MRLRTWACAVLPLVMAAGSASAAQINTFGKLEIKSDDNTFSARVTGRVHMDGNFYNSDSENRKLPSGAFIRRARIGLSGNFHAWDYSVEAEFAGETTELTDAYLSHLFGPGKATVGKFKVFEGLERLTSSNDITFIERSYVSDIVPGYRVGAAYNGYAEDAVGFAATVYNMESPSDNGEARPSNDGVGGAVRAYVAPVNDRNIAVHWGASAAYEVSDPVGARIRVSPAGRAEEYRGGEEFRFVIFDRENLLDSNDEPIPERAEIQRANFESLVINGPLSFQGEYLTGSARTKTRTADNFTAWYAQISYILTGEWRQYKFLKGEVNRPEPANAKGAVEIASRYQRANRESVSNATLTCTDFGVTYYADTNVRFLVNYSLMDNKLINDKPRLLSMRAQFDF